MQLMDTDMFVSCCSVVLLLQEMDIHGAILFFEHVFGRHLSLYSGSSCVFDCSYHWLMVLIIAVDSCWGFVCLFASLNNCYPILGACQKHYRMFQLVFVVVQEI